MIHLFLQPITTKYNQSKPNTPTLVSWDRVMNNLFITTYSTSFNIELKLSYLIHYIFKFTRKLYLQKLYSFYINAKYDDTVVDDSTSYLPPNFKYWAAHCILIANDDFVY